MSNQKVTLESLQTHLRDAADILRGSLDASEYRMPVMTILFLKRLNDPKNRARDISKVGHWGNGDYEIQIRNIENLGYVMSLIRQSYEKN